MLFYSFTMSGDIPGVQQHDGATSYIYVVEYELFTPVGALEFALVKHRLESLNL